MPDAELDGNGKRDMTDEQLGRAVALGPMGWHLRDSQWAYYNKGGQYVTKRTNWRPGYDAQDTKRLKDRMRELRYWFVITTSLNGFTVRMGSLDTPLGQTPFMASNDTEERAFCLAALGATAPENA